MEVNSAGKAVARQAIARREHATRRISPALWTFPAAILLLLASAALSTMVGAVHISPHTMLAVFAGSDAVSASDRVILLQVRLPRVLAAGIIGAALSLAGVLFQGLFRNPMADPYVLGASGGSAFGAALGLLLFPQVSVLGFSATATFAFIGSIVTILFVYALARVGGRTPIIPLLLAGIAVSMMLSEGSSMLIYMRDEMSWSARSLALWMNGSITVNDWRQIGVAAAMLLVGAALCVPLRPVLNVFALGEDYAQQLGVRVELARIAVILVGSLLTAAAVLMGGIIGFVGLLVPHIVRLVAGPAHGRLLVLSAIVGASYLIIADAFARTIIAPSEFPVGIITAFLGGPVLLYLLRRSKKEYVL